MSTFELLSIIGSIAATGIALGAVVIAGNASLRAELRAQIGALETGLSGLETRFSGLEARFSGLEARFSALETRLSAVEQRLARVEGLVEVLRDAVMACGFRKPKDRQDET